MLVDARVLTLAARSSPCSRTSSTSASSPSSCNARSRSRAPRIVSRRIFSSLRELRARVIRAAHSVGVQVSASGTHAFSRSESQSLTRRDRYRELAAELRYPLRREVCFGMHVHVAVGARRPARTAGGFIVESVLARRTAGPSLHTHGRLPVPCPAAGFHPCSTVTRSSRQASNGFSELVRSPDHSHIWWDVRPDPRFGAVEIRSVDVQPRVIDTVRSRVWCSPSSTTTAAATTRASGSRSLEPWKRRGRDSNPRRTNPPLTVFETAAFNHSATSPGSATQHTEGLERFDLTGLSRGARRARRRGCRAGASSARRAPRSVPPRRAPSLRPGPPGPSSLPPASATTRGSARS